MKRKITVYLLSVVIYLNASAQNFSSSEIYLQLNKLKNTASVLYIAAHPDDENNGFLPYLAKEKLYRTAYLSLTRGDGGQNLIGNEQGIELGMIRTQELLAARKIDGCEQYFSTAYEFGFSKNAKEALSIWDEAKVLSDVVWVIRKFQPDIIITRFPGDARAGHGHHAASSIIANEAFYAAADSTKFPEQFRYGVKPWQAKRILWNTFNFGGNNTTADNQLKVDAGIYNALLGKSYGEIGGEARSMHKSQGEGRPRRKGNIMEYFITTGGDTAKNDLMDGIITDWNKIKGGKNIQQQLDGIIKNYNIQQPSLSVTSLVKLYQSIKQLPHSAWLDKKLQDVQQMIEACSGLFSEVTTNQTSVVQGNNVSLSFFVNKRSNINASLKNIHGENFDTTLNSILNVNENISINKIIHVPATKAISQPYWLENPQSAGMFTVKDQQLIGKAENDAVFQFSFIINISGVDFTVTRPVQYKTVDAAKGETYEPLFVLPKQEVKFDKENYLLINGNSVSGNKLVKDNTLSVNAIPKESSFIIQPKGTDNLKWEISDAGVSTKTISYDHIPTITYFKPAKANVVQLNIKTEGKKIGYINGAGDKVPEALLQLGFDVHYINEQDINSAYLKQFDAIIVGIRAYNIYEWLTDKNDVLNEYIQNGGNLIVQYIKSNQVGLKKIKIGPYPFTINTAFRITEEDATINFLLPEHSVLNYPNKITDKDFEGWVQERSTYQADQIDTHFQMPIGMHDAGEKESNGSLLIAPYGKGNIAYVSLVLFRQLPAGVPGAYRLLANLIALPKH